MAIIRCKMCGGDLVFEEGATVCECEYCGSKQTIPTVNSEKKIKLFDRANRLRINCEFDKAGNVYESIIEEFPEEAEGYWGNLLCKYGIEYVDDPTDGSKVPTCHRSSFESLMDDEDFEMVMENADVAARGIYREQAKQIEEIRKGIIDVSANEQPYDIFICYKETDENGDRTLDSVLAQDVYESLTSRGYRVFFSRISLEDKLGTEYEPYIFAALNSAKIMLAFGTSYDYYNAVWVKNEWSRFLRLMAKDKTKHLIPCYKDVDAYDIPKEFSKLQAQDMGKVGAVQDLIRGIDKLMGKDGNAQTTPQSQTITQQVIGGPTAETLVERGNMLLGDGKRKEAIDYFNRALDMDLRSAEAYFGLLMADMFAKNLASAKIRFVTSVNGYSSNPNWKRAMQFASGELLMELQNWEKERNEYLDRKAEEKRKRLEREEKEKERQQLNQELFSAMKQGDSELVKKLLGRGADPNSERWNHENGNHYSVLRDSIAEYSNNKIADLLIDAGADVNYVGQITADDPKVKIKIPVMVSAIVKGNVYMVRRLLEKGADPNCERIFSDGRHMSALSDSILQWPNEMIADLLIDAGADVNYVEQNKLENVNYKTPILYDAVCKGNAAIVKKLLSKGANPNREQVYDSGARFSPLYASVIIWPNKEIARELVTAGADGKYEATYYDKSKSTILARLFLTKKDAASKLSTREKLEFVDILLDGGADFHEGDKIRKMKIYIIVTAFRKNYSQR